MNGSFCNLYVLALGVDVTYLRYTVLTSPKKDETAVHCCDLALSVLVMLVARNVPHVWYQPCSLLSLYTSGPQER